MDPRLPDLHRAALRLLARRAAACEDARDLLATPTEHLTHDRVVEAIGRLEAEIPSPVRATLFDLGRLLSGTLPDDERPALPTTLKIFTP